MKLLYIVNARIPTEKAHGLQIMQNCEAFAQWGADVTLWAARRAQTPELKACDPFDYYGVEPCFALRRLFTLDAIALFPGRSDAWAKIAFGIQLASFLSVMFGRALVTHADVYYSRDERVIALLSLIKPPHAIAYEPHALAGGRIGRTFQGWAIRRAGHLFPITHALAADLVARGAEQGKIVVAHDGIRQARFANMPAQAAARAAVGWTADLFIVGYVGRLQTMAMDKGLSTLVEAFGQLQRIPGAPIALAVVGGPETMAEALRAEWIARGLPPERFMYAGQVAPDRVPRYIAAFDVCAMPHPYQTHFARHTSPLKLFEYMASRRAIIASNLEAFAEVVTHEHSALLVPPSDAIALAAAIARLYDDLPLRERLAQNALTDVMQHYTWEARARRILARWDGI